MHSRDLDSVEELDETWELPTDIPELGKHGAEEVTLYLRREPKVVIRVNGERATLFRPGDQITIRRSDQCHTLCLQVTGGDFTGHIMPVSRSKRESMNLSHLAIVLKTLRRPEVCAVKVHLQACP